MAKLTNHVQRTTLRTPSTNKHYSLDSEDDFRSGCWNVSHQQQFFSELLSSGQSHNMNHMFYFLQPIFFRDKVKQNWLDLWLTRGWLVTQGWPGLTVGSCTTTPCFSIQRCLGVLIVCKARGLEVQICLFVFKMTSFRHLILKFIKATFPEKVNQWTFSLFLDFSFFFDFFILPSALIFPLSSNKNMKLNWNKQTNK